MMMNLFLLGSDAPCNSIYDLGRLHPQTAEPSSFEVLNTWNPKVALISCCHGEKHWLWAFGAKSFRLKQKTSTLVIKQNDGCKLKVTQFATHRTSGERECTRRRWKIRHLFTSSRMRSKGPCFTLGVWGLRVCSPDVKIGQPFTTVRNRSREGPMAVPLVNSFRVAGVALRDMPTWSNMFDNVSKFVLHLHRDFAWEAQHLFTCRVAYSDVSCCVLFLRTTLSGPRQVMQILWQALHYVRCDENWHRFWGGKFWSSCEKTRRKT